MGCCFGRGDNIRLMFIGESGGSHCEETNGFLWDLHIFVGSDDILNDVKDIRNSCVCVDGN